MAKRKSFKAYVPEDSDVAFDVNGTEFKCIPMMTGTALLDFTSRMDETNPATMARAVTELLDLVIDPEQLEAWHVFAADPVNGVSMELLAEIAGWITEEYVGHPTGPSDSSSDGPVPTGPLRPAKPSSVA